MSSLISLKPPLESEISEISNRLMGIALQLPKPWRHEALTAVGKLVQLEVAMEMNSLKRR